MNHYFVISAFILLGYLIGSIPFSYLTGMIFRRVDIRKHGSRNVGATNVLRVLGWKYGLIALLLDVGKGILAIFLLQKSIANPASLTLILTGLAAILGHMFPIFLKFKGGKGVATSAGVFFYLVPLTSLAALIVFICTVIISRYVSLGSLLAALTLFLIQLHTNIKNGFSEPELFGFVTITVIFIFIGHRSNIRRLLTGSENRIRFHKG
ncbi:MAG: glycerol-3-phosphate 1-O-acyltransferase PlsY [Candidatus Cloacimonetes bacterium]|nr:glycerol-3-phosphate 1-O-acyltransferase PlsY [Candidatus Cloacimonadota bacterium]